MGFSYDLNPAHVSDSASEHWGRRLPSCWFVASVLNDCGLSHDYCFDWCHCFAIGKAKGNPWAGGVLGSVGADKFRKRMKRARMKEGLTACSPCVRMAGTGGWQSLLGYFQLAPSGVTQYLPSFRIHSQMKHIFSNSLQGAELFCRSGQSKNVFFFRVPIRNFFFSFIYFFLRLFI